MIQRLNARTARVGFFAVGHATYWGQFDGLLDSLLARHTSEDVLTDRKLLSSQFMAFPRKACYNMK